MSHPSAIKLSILAAGSKHRNCSFLVIICLCDFSFMHNVLRHLSLSKQHWWYFFWCFLFRRRATRCPPFTKIGSADDPSFGYCFNNHSNISLSSQNVHEGSLKKMGQQKWSCCVCIKSERRSCGQVVSTRGLQSSPSWNTFWTWPS